MRREEEEEEEKKEEMRLKVDAWRATCFCLSALMPECLRLLPLFVHG